MNLLLLLWALETGIYEAPSALEGTVYVQPEVGLEFRDLFFICEYNLAYSLADDEFTNKELTLKLFINHEGVSFGIDYKIDLECKTEQAKLFFRYQSWR